MNKKKKVNKKVFPTEYVMETVKNCSLNEIIETVNWYLNMNDGSKISENDTYIINNLFEQYPNLIKLICVAFEEKGYDSF